MHHVTPVPPSLRRLDGSDSQPTSFGSSPRHRAASPCTRFALENPHLQENEIFATPRQRVRARKLSVRGPSRFAVEHHQLSRLACDAASAPWAPRRSNPVNVTKGVKATQEPRQPSWERGPCVVTLLKLFHTRVQS